MKFPFSRLLLATEHTEFDVGAERVALEIAGQYGTQLYGVLPIVRNDEYESIAPEAVIRAEELAFAQVKQLRDDARAVGVNFDGRVRRGEESYQEIIGEAMERDAELIVIRRRGKRGFLANLLVGEMAGKVAMHAPCSVLLVPRVGRMWSQRILVGVDESRATVRVAETAARLAAVAGVALEVLSAAVHDTAEGRAKAGSNVDAALSIAQSIGVAGNGRVMAGRTAETITHHAAACGADLIVVGRGGEGSHARRFRPGKTAHGVIGFATCPVLIVKA